jgi:hypothetical protein
MLITLEKQSIAMGLDALPEDIRTKMLDGIPKSDYDIKPVMDSSQISFH